MAEPAIDIQQVHKSFDGHAAVRNLSLQVPRGTVYGLLGPNGAGKTTTIRMILDIIEPDSGTITIFGQSSIRGRDGNRIGYLPEERGLYKKMQVRRVLRFLAELKGVRGGDADKRIELWLERLSLTGGDKDWGSARVEELSRGMQQKVQFIGALLHEPDLVILDEPFSGLDPMNAQALKDTIVDLRRDGRTVIFSTHLMENAERLCDALCIIANGEKVLDGTVAAVKAEHGGQYLAIALGEDRSAAIDDIFADRSVIMHLDDSNRTVEIELAPNASPQLLLRRLIDAGAVIERFELVQPSLHRIFIDTVGATDVEPGMSGHG
ncbi:MAG: transporter related protein [Gemmatimonadetes bacterium]|nr:transporter related protein [Gemmatimonadota bacterium]